MKPAFKVVADDLARASSLLKAIAGKHGKVAVLIAVPDQADFERWGAPTRFVRIAREGHDAELPLHVLDLPDVRICLVGPSQLLGLGVGLCVLTVSELLRAKAT